MVADLTQVFQSILDIRRSIDESANDINNLTADESPHYKDQVRFLTFAARRAPLSSAQLLQDLWVLFELQEKRGGYFVEIGGCDGSSLSNTILLERIFGWRGAIAEPARIWQESLRANRTCFLTDKFIYTHDGSEVLFNQTPEAELSTLDTLSSADRYAGRRQDGERYEVETVTLLSLLRAAGAPKQIDYVSIDTEGSEYEILEAFDFSIYDIKLLTIDHDHTERRNDICNLMRRNGYRCRFEVFSGFDDWYIKD